MSETPPTAFPETLPLVDEPLPGETPDGVPLEIQAPFSPATSGVATPNSEAAHQPHSPQLGIPASPGVRAEPHLEGESCPTHRVVSNLICLDPLCGEFRCFRCPECMIELHVDCRKEVALDVESFAKALRPDTSSFRGPYQRFLDVLAVKNLEFTLKASVDAAFAREEAYLAALTWRDFLKPTPHLILEPKDGFVSVTSERLAKLGKLFEQSAGRLESEVSAELFGVTLVAFEKAMSEELSLEPRGESTPHLDDNFDVLSSSFSKKNYSDDSQVFEQEQEFGDPQAFVRTHTASVVGQEQFADMVIPTKRRATEDSSKDRKKRDLRKAGTTKIPKEKPLRKTYLAPLFEYSKILNPDDVDFLEGLVGADFKIEPLFSSDRDGLSVEAFHAKCDNKGPTLCFVQAEKGRAGGWSDRSWLSTDSALYSRSNNTFLFSLDKRKKYPVKVEEKTRAVFTNRHMGPCFGDDFVVSGLLATPDSHSRLGSVYDAQGIENPFEELFGAGYFAVQRMEVFSCVSPAHLGKEASFAKAMNGSTILAESNLGYLMGILPDFSQVSLLFRSKDVEYTPQLFHRMCDNQGPTLTVIRVGTAVGGGYTSTDWKSAGGYCSATTSFIFSLTKERVFPVKNSSTNNAIFCRELDGPNFGDRDLYISDNLRTKTNRTYLGSYYDAAGTDNPKGFLFGEEYFVIDEFEVYSIEA